MREFFLHIFRFSVSVVCSAGLFFQSVLGFSKTAWPQGDCNGSCSLVFYRSSQRVRILVLCCCSPPVVLLHPSNSPRLLGSSAPMLTLPIRRTFISATQNRFSSFAGLKIVIQQFGSNKKVVLNRPKALNALNLSMIRGLTPLYKVEFFQLVK